MNGCHQHVFGLNLVLVTYMLGLDWMTSPQIDRGQIFDLPEIGQVK